MDDPYCLKWPDDVAFFEGKRARLRVRGYTNEGVHAETIGSGTPAMESMSTFSKATKGIYGQRTKWW